MRTRRGGLFVALALAVVVFPRATVFSQSFPAGMAKNASGTLVAVRTDGTESRLRGRGALQLFEGDTLRVEGDGQALVETDEGIQVVLNSNAAVKILSRWEKGKGVTRILRLQRGELLARNRNSPQPVEIETPVAVVAARAAEVSVRLVSESEALGIVIEGTAELSTPQASCQLRPGTVSFGYRGRPCTNPSPADTRSITRWSRPLLAQ
jgi:hypothetical protein